jgi:hypothetical protein
MALTSPIIYATLAGSRLYGLEDDNSDVDLCLFHVDPIDTRLGLFKAKPNVTLYYVPNEAIALVNRNCPGPKVLDVQSTDIVEAFKLALEGNPNMVELMFSPVGMYRICMDTSTLRMTDWEHKLAWLFDKPERLITQQYIEKCLGYARSQYDAGLITFDAPTRKLGAARKALVDRWGFDTKAASHAYRLAAMARDAISDRTVLPLKPGVKTLCRRIKAGELARELVRDIIEDTLEEAEAYLKSASRECLPRRANTELYNNQLVNFLLAYHEKS